MNYLQLVQESLYRCGVRSENPTTLVGALDITADFARWVQDGWRELQEESINWWFRQKLNQTMAVSASTDTYSMPANLETLNYRTCTIYTTAQTDESLLYKMTYEDWRIGKDTTAYSENRPDHIIESPSGEIILWPVPDQAYTLRYDGVWDIDTMSDDTDTPGSTISGSTLLPERYQHVLVYDAMRRFAEHHEDAPGLEKAQRKYLAQHARLAEKQRPEVSVPMGVLTGYGARSRRWW